MIPYSVIFPIKDINAGELLTCDLIPKNVERESDKLAYLLAFEQRLAPGQEINKEKRGEIIKVYEVGITIHLYFQIFFLTMIIVVVGIWE